MLLVPSSIAERPWNMVAEYLTLHGPTCDLDPSGSTYTMVLHLRPDYILTTIEIQLPRSGSTPTGCRWRGHRRRHPAHTADEQESDPKNPRPPVLRATARTTSEIRCAVLRSG